MLQSVKKYAKMTLSIDENDFLKEMEKNFEKIFNRRSR
ncbi:hypothetical protein RR45_GL001225 [Lactococcus chungangensis CAU 28 = DSM 22330]|uniref:Uncharacterized protein n=1 Tax=Pseudolactococcus chungangensis CAU 28 = DSM 22330 TaxID=1122154 RepID=A0ABX4I4M8_9LACT|nr:hypothetical protein RR45_GL001225 [Lactococcus chungangensis CAU 28 = DSM 22330]